MTPPSERPDQRIKRSAGPSERARRHRGWPFVDEVIDAVDKALQNIQSE